MTNLDWIELANYVVEFVRKNTEGADNAAVIATLRQERPGLEEGYTATFKDAVIRLLESPAHQ